MASFSDAGLITDAPAVPARDNRAINIQTGDNFMLDLRKAKKMDLGRGTSKPRTARRSGPTGHQDRCGKTILDVMDAEAELKLSSPLNMKIEYTKIKEVQKICRNFGFCFQTSCAGLLKSRKVIRFEILSEADQPMRA